MIYSHRILANDGPLKILKVQRFPRGSGRKGPRELGEHNSQAQKRNISGAVSGEMDKLSMANQVQHLPPRDRW
jgi:hypothetical protein